MNTLIFSFEKISKSVCVFLFIYSKEWMKPFFSSVFQIFMCRQWWKSHKSWQQVRCDADCDQPSGNAGFFSKLRRKIPDADKVWEEEKSEAQCEIILINVTDAAACVCVCVYCDTVHCITACNSGTVRGLWWVYWSTRGTLQFLTAPTILPAPELCGVQGKMGFLSSLTTSREKKKKPVPDTARTSVKVKDDGPR